MKKHPLPNENHDVVEDILRIEEVFNSIDSDIYNLEDDISDKKVIVEDLGARALTVSNTSLETEIQELNPGGYLIYREEGFTTVEGGGNAGGAVNQCLSKNSDANYDTGWRDLHGIPDGCYLLRDRAESDVFASTRATKHNYGTIKIGAGVSVNDGEISVFGGGHATKNEYGMVCIGEGFTETESVIDFSGFAHADSETLGLVNPGDDFEFNENGELELAQEITGTPVVYKLSDSKRVENGIIEIDPNIAVYKAEIHENTHFSIEDFEQTDDLTIFLEVISDNIHRISFDFSGDFTSINGSLTIKLSRLLYSDSWTALAERINGCNVTLLTPNLGTDVMENLYYETECANYQCYTIMNTVSSSNLAFTLDPREIFCMFSSKVLVSSLLWHDESDDPEQTMELLASNDKQTWSTILIKTGLANGQISVNSFGWYKYFKIKFYSGRAFRGMALYGYAPDIPETKLVRVLPVMASNTSNGAAVTSIVSSTTAYQVSIGNGSGPRFGTSGGIFWLQYEFDNPVVSNVFELGWGVSYGDEKPYGPYKLEGSNDATNWTELFAKDYVATLSNNTTRVFEFTNSTAYKYYKFTQTRSNVCN